MPERMHKTYTLIPERSWRAMVVRAEDRDNPTLAMVLRSLAVDPDEAKDIADDGVPIDISLNAFSLSGRRTQALQTVAEWAVSQKDSRPALKSIAAWNRKLGVWCACQVAREALPYVPDGEIRPLKAIEASERWVIGRAKLDAVRIAAAAAALAGATSSVSSARSAAYSAYNAASAATSVSGNLDGFNRGEGPVHARESAPYSAAAIGIETGRSEQDELVRLKQVVADACMRFPAHGSGMVRSAGNISAHPMWPAAIVGAMLGAGAMHFAKRS